MKFDSISRLTSVTIDLNEITSAEVADHFPQFSDVLAKVIEQVLEEMGYPTKIDIMTPEELSLEAEQYEEDFRSTGKLHISMTETFPCK